MHLMTRVPETARVRAPFHEGAVFRFKDDTAHLSERNGTRFVRLSSPGAADHVYRVTRIIGGRVREDYAGVEVASESAAASAIAVPGRAPDAELLLPISYVFEPPGFRLKGYSVLVGERPGLRAGGIWNETCIFCHNTTPYFDSTWGQLHGRGAPSYQGEVVDRLLPADRRWQFELAQGSQGEASLLRAVDEELSAVGGEPVAAQASGDRRLAMSRAIAELRRNFSARHLVEVGIGCEACHGGSREHVNNQRVLPDFAPRSAFLTSRPEAAGK